MGTQRTWEEIVIALLLASFALYEFTKWLQGKFGRGALVSELKGLRKEKLEWQTERKQLESKHSDVTSIMRELQQGYNTQLAQLEGTVAARLDKIESKLGQQGGSAPEH
eukprot:c12415_g1_i2.p2 GENE.c12415_g1_i2~~c12415_g1_i2.p2  ORF type:complete len:109 (+),score=30.55 c12415_g1_i2:3-329(+)